VTGGGGTGWRGRQGEGYGCGIITRGAWRGGRPAAAGLPRRWPRCQAWPAPAPAPNAAPGRASRASRHAPRRSRTAALAAAAQLLTSTRRPAGGAHASAPAGHSGGGAGWSDKPAHSSQQLSDLCAAAAHAEPPQWAPGNLRCRRVLVGDARRVGRAGHVTPRGCCSHAPPLWHLPPSRRALSASASLLLAVNSQPCCAPSPAASCCSAAPRAAVWPHMPQRSRRPLLPRPARACRRMSRRCTRPCAPALRWPVSCCCGERAPAPRLTRIVVRSQRRQAGQDGRGSRRRRRRWRRSSTISLAASAVQTQLQSRPLPHRSPLRAPSASPRSSRTPRHSPSTCRSSAPPWRSGASAAPRRRPLLPSARRCTWRARARTLRCSLSSGQSAALCASSLCRRRSTTPSVSRRHPPARRHWRAAMRQH
jgi:hypothetical protein